MITPTADGKYTFYTKKDEYAIFCDRYDTKEWMVFEKGHNAIMALMWEVEKLQTANAELRAELSSDVVD